MQCSLKWINNADLEGVSCIRLVDELPKPSPKSPEVIKEAFNQGFNIYGLYNRGNKTMPPSITLNIADIYKGVPRFYWFSPLPTLLIAYWLAHEVGHHIVAKRGYIINVDETEKLDEDEEAFANRYAFSIHQRMLVRFYYRLGDWAIRDLSEWHYVFGINRWKSKNYVKAAEHLYNAWVLDPNNEEAAYWYKRAKEDAKNITTG